MYAEVQDVQNYYQGLKFSENSAVSLRAVNDLLKLNQQYIDSRLSSVVLFPISQTGKIVLQNILTKLVVSEIDRILRENEKGDTENLKFKRNFKKEAEDMLDMIENRIITIGETKNRISSEENTLQNRFSINDKF